MKILSITSVLAAVLLLSSCGISNNEDGGYCDSLLVSDYNDIVYSVQASNYGDALDELDEFRSYYPNVNCKAADGTVINNDKLDSIETGLLLVR